MSFSPLHNVDLITSDVTIFWFRRDLRLDDNAGLYHALRENRKVLPVFIFDDHILNKLDVSDARVEFILNSLQSLQNSLTMIGSSLLVLQGKPARIFSSVSPKNVYANHDYEPYAIDRDQKVRETLHRKGIPFHTSKDHVIFEKNEVVKSDGGPYTVFTPYSRKWKSSLNESWLESFPCKHHYASLLKTSPLCIPTLSQIGFRSGKTILPEPDIKEDLIRSYSADRDYPAMNGTSRLGIHIRFGTISIRKLVALAQKHSETWMNQLIWREFYAMILWHFPYVETRSFKPVYDRITWRNDETDFQRWCEGRTGYTLVDAGMRELNTTGFMHNRVRMIAATFLTKHLLIDWRWGEAYFASTLLDYDLASNNGNWQWAAGSGCDAAPYFRIFNPDLQQRRFDATSAYVRRWVSEYDGGHPQRIVEHNFARQRAIATYGSALRK